MKVRKTLATLGILLGAAGGTAWAAGAIGSIVAADGTINGCYQQNNGQLRVVAAGEACRDSELALSWAQKGSAGEAGARGEQGPAGPQGQQGPAGERGPQGERGTQGEQGARGEAGADGVDGTDGQDGLDGQDGEDGAKGDKGDKGDTGLQGPKGDDGEPGAPGAPGPEGPQGPPGAGATVASLDDLDGIPCNVGHSAAGVVRLAYSTETPYEATITCQPTALYALTVTKAGNGAGAVTSSPTGISCGSTCSHEYAVGKLVTLTAAAVGNDAFAGWSGACSGLSPTCTVTMDAAKATTATFEARETLSVTVSSVYSCGGFTGCTWGNAQVTLSTGGVCNSGSILTSRVFRTCGFDIPTGAVVTASSNKPGVWSGCDSVAADVCSVTMTGARSIGIQ